MSGNPERHGALLDGTLELRPPVPNDVPGITEIYRPIVRDTHISFELDPPSIDEMSRRVFAPDSIYPWLVASDRDGVIGYAYASQLRSRAAYRWSAEVSVYVASRARGRGIARALYEALFQWMRCQGFTSAFAGIALPNEASVALHRSVGFDPIGVFPRIGFKQGRWWDVSWWVRPLRAEGEAPAELRSPAEAWDDPACREHIGIVHHALRSPEAGEPGSGGPNDS